MEYLILVGVALVKRWIERIGWGVLDAVFVVLALIAMLVYLGLSVFSDEE